MDAADAEEGPLEQDQRRSVRKRGNPTVKNNIIDEVEWQEWQEWKEWKRWKEEVKKKDTQDPSNDEKHTTLLDESEAGVSRERPINPNPRYPGGNAERQYVLSGRPTGWAALDTVIRGFDEEKVRDCKEDIDTLLVFAGLFSAVLTAFLVESYSTLLEDTVGESLVVLRQIAIQTSSYELRGAFANSTVAPSSFLSTPFEPSSVNIRINVLWFASLLFSLIAASFGILVKQWLREYLAVQNPSPQARLRVRHLRYPQLAVWQIFEIAAVLPILLQLSLALFFVGLCYFTASVHPSIGYTTLPLVAGWAFCVIVAALLPLFFPRCPYRTTLLKGLFSIFHRLVRELAIRIATWTSVRLARHNRARTIRTLLWTYIHQASVRVAQERDCSNEAMAVQSSAKDLEILADADAIQSNDELFGTTIAEAASQIAVNPDVLGKLPSFVFRVLVNRSAAPSSNERATHALIVDLRTTALSPQAQAAILDLVECCYHNLPLTDLHTFESSISCLRSSFIVAIMLSLSGRNVQQIPQLAALLSSRAMAAQLQNFCCELVRHYHQSPGVLRTHNAIEGRTDTHPDQTIHRLLLALSTLQGVLDGWLLKPPGLLDTILRGYSGNSVDMEHASRNRPENEEGLAAIPWEVAQWPWREMPDDLKVAATNFLQSHLHHLQHLIDFPNTPSQLHSGTRILATSYFQVDTAVAETLVALFCTARHHERLWSKTSWRLVFWKMLSSTEGSATTLAGAVSNTPSADILCLVTQIISTGARHRFRPQKSPFESQRDMLSCWKAVISLVPQPRDPMNNGHILRLCCFSIYSLLLIHGHQSPTLLKGAWTEVFELFADKIQQIDKRVVPGDLADPTRLKITKLATACLEIIRHEEINARSWQEWPWSAKKGVLVFRSDESENSQDKIRRMMAQWRTPPMHSVFPEQLIIALEGLAEPSWFVPVDMQSSEMSDFSYECICHELLCPRIHKLKSELLALYQ